jgi:exopolysaccharide biosynthesis polyprenyl glycosylphosphotransferase
MTQALPAPPRVAVPAVRERPWWHPLLRRGLPPLVLAADLLAIAVAAGTARSRLPVLLLGAVMLVLLLPTRLYRSRLELSLLDDLPLLLARWAVATGIVVAVEASVLPPAPASHVLPAAVVLLGALLACRGLAYLAVRRLRASGLIAHRTIVVGTDDTARLLVQALREHPRFGLVPVGFVDDSDATSLDDLPVLGRPCELSVLLRLHQASVVVVCSGSAAEPDVVQALRWSHREPCEVFVVPRLHELHPVAGDAEAVWGLPVVRLRRAAYRSLGWRLKRVLDVVVALAAAVVLAPVLLAAAVAVRLDGGPGVIFRQQRVGVDGRCFDVLKFRSLRPADDQESATRWTVAGDRRMSRVGRLLRATSIDELPQLWNILRGDMSLVGPRPERPHFVDEFARTYPSYGARHRVPSGLTGWAQVNGLRGDTSIGDRARFDNYYVENWSLWLDLTILLRTVTAVVAARGS